MFSSKDVPAVGVSIGIERVFNLLEDKIMAGCKDGSGAVCGKIRETATEVLLMLTTQTMWTKTCPDCSTRLHQPANSAARHLAAVSDPGLIICQYTLTKGGTV